MNGDELGRILSEVLDRRFKENLQPIEKRLGNVEEGQKETQQRLAKVERNMATKDGLQEVKTDVQTLKVDLAEVKKNMVTKDDLKSNLTTISKILVSRTKEYDDRLDRLEQHAGLPPLS